MAGIGQAMDLTVDQKLRSAYIEGRQPANGIVSMLEELFQGSTQSVKKTVLERAAEAIEHENYQALAKAAKEIVLAYRDDPDLLDKAPHLTEALMVIAARLGRHADHLPQSLDAVSMATVLSNGHPRLERRGVKTWESLVSDLAKSNIVKALIAAESAANQAFEDSLFGKRAVEMWVSLQKTLARTDQGKALTIAEAVVRSASANSPLAQQARAKIRDEYPSPLSSAAVYSFVRKFRLG